MNEWLKLRMGVGCDEVMGCLYHLMPQCPAAPCNIYGVPPTPWGNLSSNDGVGGDYERGHKPQTRPFHNN